jgi:hypothetical protein
MVDSTGCTAKMMLWCSLLRGGLCCSGGIIIIGVHVGLCSSVLWQINVGVDLLCLHSLICWWRVESLCSGRFFRFHQSRFRIHVKATNLPTKTRSVVIVIVRNFGYSCPKECAQGHIQGGKGDSHRVLPFTVQLGQMMDPSHNQLNLVTALTAG